MVLDKGQDFLQRVTFLMISTNQGDLLNADITETEIQMTIRNLGKHRDLMGSRVSSLSHYATKYHSSWLNILTTLSIQAIFAQNLSTHL